MVAAVPRRKRVLARARLHRALAQRPAAGRVVAVLTAAVAARVVELDDGRQGGLAAIVEVGSRQRDVAQARRLEGTVDGNPGVVDLTRGARRAGYRELARIDLEWVDLDAADMLPGEGERIAERILVTHAHIVLGRPDTDIVEPAIVERRPAVAHDHVLDQLVGLTRRHRGALNNGPVWQLTHL